MKTLLVLLIISLSLTSPQDQAERLYDNALTFMNAGKYNEAITDFSSIINDHGETDWAPRALLELSTYYLNVEKDSSKALTFIDKIQATYPQSDQAPAAFYYKALIATDEGKTRADLEAASANLIRMKNLFPDNSWGAQALFLFGRLSLRLGDYSQSLNHFQRLEFSEPNTPDLPAACLLSARSAFLDGKPGQAALILARLQARMPNSAEAETAAAHLRLLDHFSSGKKDWQLDKTFFGAAPKRFANPTVVFVSSDEVVAIKGQKTMHTAPLGAQEERSSGSVSDLVGFTGDRWGKLLMVYKNRVASPDGSVSFKGLSAGGSTLREIKAASVDGYGRLYVVDGSSKDLLVYGPDGSFLKGIKLNKPSLVRSYGNTTLVLGDGGLKAFDADLSPHPSPFPGLNNITDYCFDAYGNFYVVHEKGSQVSIFAQTGGRLANFNLKSGAYPLKQAWSVAVDAAGAFYLADRRGGAVYRFH